MNLRNYITWILCFACAPLLAQDTADLIKPFVPKSEVRQLVHMSDSLHKHLKILYGKEVKANTPNAYQPERIAAIRTYLLLFDYVLNRCEVARFKKSDVIAIFGKPDTTLYKTNKHDFQLYYNKVIKQYVRIVNLRYRFYFKDDELVRVERENV